MATFTPPKQVVLLESTPELKSLMSIIRNKDTARGDFIFYSKHSLFTLEDFESRMLNRWCGIE